MIFVIPLFLLEAFPKWAGTIDAICVSAALNFILILWLILTEDRRHARRAIVPLLVIALGPLRSGEEELRHAIAQARADGLYIARLVDADSLCRLIDRTDQWATGAKP